MQYASAYGGNGDLSEDEVAELPSCVYASRSASGGGAHGTLSPYLLHHSHISSG